MKKVMKFVKGKREEETPIKNTSVETKKMINEKVDEIAREDDFISRDKTITKLHKAVWNENSDKLKSIIKTHDIDITDKLDRTALYFAVLKNNPDIVNLLLENSANQNIPDIDGITPFLKSVQLGHKQCAAILLNHGADIKKTDKDLNSCLHFAIREKRSDMLTFLLEHSVEFNIPNVNGEYPLHIAIQIQDKETVELLLNYNMDMNVVNNCGLTPLMLAEQLNNLEIIELLENYSLKMSKDNNLFPDEISHKSSYENVNTPKIEQKQLVKSDDDTWNDDSPVKSPNKKQEKPSTKITKHFFNEEVEIVEEKSESDVSSVKCSENTSPQSGIIPPPCKPLRSLEYLQSGMTMENRPVHLLTLGTVRTRHISMTESDHSKNNTPHRYSYQGDLQAANGDSFQKNSDHFSGADEKGDSVNVSIKSKLLSKLECDSTIQSDWGSNESLPLDELSCGGKKEKSLTSSTSKNNSNSNSGSIRDKSTDIFLQKQFSLLEDYEKNREKRCSVSYEMDSLTVKVDKDVNNSDSHLDDIDNLLEDNNRINAQLEKYAGQSDTLVRVTKSKSLPRNCEPYNNYHKGSFSLPRTLESGKDPFREMRSYGYFKPRSHFSFSLKMLKGDKKSGFIDKLKSMFNKKSQIHLTEQSENGTWLYKKTDNEYYSSKLDSSFSGSENSKSPQDKHDLPVSNTLNNFHSVLDEFDEDSKSEDPSFSNNEQNKVIEKNILSLNNMSADTSSSPRCNNENCPGKKVSQKSMFSMVKKTGSQSSFVTSLCDDCSEFFNQKLIEAEETVESKEKFIGLLQNQLEQLKDRYIKNIDEGQDLQYKYSIAQQEILSLKQICTKYDEQLQKRKQDKGLPTREERVSKLKEEIEKWKNQYEELQAKVNLTKGEDLIKNQADEEEWRRIIQNEVQTAVNILKESSQTVILTLEKQNKNLESMIEKLQQDLETSGTREEKLQSELEALKNNLVGSSNKNDFEETLATLQKNNDQLQKELAKMTELYNALQVEYNVNLKQIEEERKKSTEEINTVKEELYGTLTRSLSGLSEEIVKAKENALAKNEELRQQIVEMGPETNMKEFVNKITGSLENIENSSPEGNSRSDSIGDITEQIAVLNTSISDVGKINEINTEIETKILEVKSEKKICTLTKKCNNLLCKINQLNKEVDLLRTESKSQNDVIEIQTEQINNLNDIIDNEKQKNDILESEIISAKDETDTERKAKGELLQQVEELQTEYREEKKSNEQLTEEIKELTTEIIEERKSNEQLTQKIEEFNTELSSSSEEKRIIKEENSNIRKSLDEMKNMSEDMTRQLRNSQDTIDKMGQVIKEKSETIEKLENVYNEKAQKIEASCGEKIGDLINENSILKQQLWKEQESITSLRKHIDSLKCYHENEKYGNNEKLKQLENENKAIKINLETIIDKLTQKNSALEKQLYSVTEENKTLQKNINELTEVINSINEKLQDTDIFQDPQKFSDAIESLNQENIEMKNAMTNLREILEVKLGEKFSNEIMQVSSIRSANKECCPEEDCQLFLVEPTEIKEVKRVEFSDSDKPFPTMDEETKEDLIQQVNNIEKRVEELVDDVSDVPNGIKSSSLPNLDEQDIYTDKNQMDQKKSSSVECVVCCDRKDSEEKQRWDKYLESVTKLRSELTDILHKLESTDTLSGIELSTEGPSLCQANKCKRVTFEDVETSTQEDQSYVTNEKNPLESELYNLRKELYKQKVERIKDNEIAKIQKNTEVFAMQQHLKYQFLESKQKLLLDLNIIQQALQVKNEEELKLRQKCNELVKEVTASQKARKKKLQNISSLTYKPSTVKEVVIYNVSHASHPKYCSTSTGDLQKPVKSQIHFTKAKVKFNTTIEQHHVNTESVPDQSTNDEELENKYLFL